MHIMRLNLGFMISLPIGRTDQLLVVDPMPDTDSGSLFHFPRHCGIGDFTRVISISHTMADHVESVCRSAYCHLR